MNSKDKEAIIRVEGLSKHFGDIKAVDNISLDVYKGEVFAFLGPNGAGKSTTIRILTTMLNQTSGHVFIDGHDTLKQKDRVRNSFGIVFQDPSLDTELTAYENMEFHAALYNVPDELGKKRIKGLLELVQLWDRRNNLVKTFSGGMKRRLEIARGLIHHPKILFLDEPTLGLDTQTRYYLWEHVRGLNKKENMTVFFTTHNLDEAERIASRIAIIDKGKLIMLGTATEIKKKTGTKSLEKAFLKLTGSSIREEMASPADMMRLRQGMRH